MSDHEDRSEIYSCMMRYIRGVDRHDCDLIASAFWPEALINFGKMYQGGLAGFIEWVNRAHTEMSVNHQHHLTGHHIDIDGDQAHAEENLIWFLHKHDGNVTIGSVRHLDRFERRDGEWKIVGKRFLPELMLDLDKTTVRQGVTKMGTWNHEDPSYARPLEVLAAHPERLIGLP